MSTLKLLVIFITFHLVEIVTSRDAPVVMIPEQGNVMGTFLKMYRTQNIVAYLGIPFAQPPIGDKRFMAPVVENLPSWEGIRNATTFPPDCWQNPDRNLRKHDELFSKLIKNSRPVVEDEDRYNEDCLFLNIFIPDGPPPMEGYAVVAWLHSGDFSYGSPTELDPFQLVFKQKVIVVTIAYRLNIFGFLTSLDGEAPGNFGLMDQTAGLTWIKRNIKLFGGNENSITLMGHGSGAISVNLHLTSGDWSEGLFDKAIIMSGSALTENSVREPSVYLQTLDSLANSFGCLRRPTSDLMVCLRRVNDKLLTQHQPFVEWGPIIDTGLSNTTAPFIAENPRELVKHNILKKVPLLIGFTDMEDILDITTEEMMEVGISAEMYDSLLTDVIVSDLSHLESNETWCGNIQIVIDAVGYAYKHYPPITDGMRLRKMFIDFNVERNYIAPSLYLASAMSKHETTYAYRFDIKSRTPSSRENIPEWVGVPHNFDMIFIWGMPYWTNSEMINSWDTTDKRISDIIMTLWANFVKFSNPTKSGVYIKWENFTADQPGILVIDRAFNMTDEMNFRAIQFWNDYYHKAVHHAANCCNSTNLAGISLLSNYKELKDNFVKTYFFIFIAYLLLKMFSSESNSNPKIKLLT